MIGRCFSPAVLAALFLTAPLLAKVELSSWIASPQKLWATSGNEIIKKHGKFLAWSDGSKNSIYCPANSLKEFFWNNKPVYDLRLTLKKGKVSDISILLYSRGDAGKAALDEEKFKAFVNQLNNDCAQRVPGVLPKRSNAKIGGTKTSIIARTGKQMNAVIKYGLDKKDQPEFVVLEFAAPNHTIGGTSSRSMRSTSRNRDVVKNIKRDSNGDVYIIVPMVDQGSKGYCVPASVERVLLYYGASINQNTLAQMLGADAAKGTNLDRTVEKLREIDGRIGLVYAPRVDCSEFEPSKIRRFIRKYNKQAKREKKKLIKSPKNLLDQLDYNLYKKIRKNSRRSEYLLNKVKEDIDRGVPVFWSVITFPADKTAGNQKKAGLHLRLITGYNMQKKTIIFSDSWGRNHEKKSLPLEDAWCISLKTFVMSIRR